MRAMKPSAWIWISLAATALDASAAQWTQLRADGAAKLSIDTASVKRKGDEVSLKYLVDYAKPQGDVLYQVRYVSVVTAATLRCKPRTVSLGASQLYSGPAATGVLLATAEPSAKERAFAPVEKGTSDEDLWRHACGKNTPENAKNEPEKKKS